MVLKSEVSISVHYRTYDILDCKTARTLHPRTRTSYTFLPSLSTSLIISNLHTRQSWWERHRTQQANVLIFSSNWNEFLKIARPHFFFLIRKIALSFMVKSIKRNWLTKTNVSESGIEGKFGRLKMKIWFFKNVRKCMGFSSHSYLCTEPP